MFQQSRSVKRLLAAAVLALAAGGVQAACLDNVVLVHGNTGAPAD